MTVLVDHQALRRTVVVVALANLIYGIFEFVVARAIGSVSLFADSIDFFEDASVNVLIFFALAWTAATRARVGMAMAALLLVPASATVWMLVEKFRVPVAPDAFTLSLTGVGALVVNLSCALLLARYRRHSGSMTKAAFLSARNDAIANVAIVAAGLVTAYAWRSAWPDVLVGLAIAWLNIDAANEIWRAARSEQRSATP